MREITLPEAKPAFEWVNGRALQKMGPKSRHSLAQTRFTIALDAWARKYGRGMVGTEWRFRIQPLGEVRRPLVPDVAFLSYTRVPREELLVTEEPLVAPDVVVEVRSPGDRDKDIEHKVGVYLACGTRVIFLVDPKKQTVTVRDPLGRQQFDAHDTLVHEALPGFRLAVNSLFTLPVSGR